ncbi:hypothetical protein [Panacagrimonas sp.]|uniref:hypothetical protein n=1 Tax=Panacagrimonas sp. TaxID=2480088 RepID=UPI003B51F1FA
MNILIADDDAVSAALAGALLQRLGLPGARIARDAAALHHALAGGDLDVLLINLRLPSLDVSALTAPRNATEDPAAAPPIWIELQDSAAAELPLALRKPLQRDALQAALDALDHHAETWAELLRLFGPAGAREMLAALQRDLRAQREVLAQNPADRTQLRGIAHRLRGAALQLGAGNLALHGARAEQLAASDTDADAAQTLSRLLRVLGRFEALVRYLERQLES